MSLLTPPGPSNSQKPMPSVNSSSAISIPSASDVSSGAVDGNIASLVDRHRSGERKLLPKEAQSDFMEDHLLYDITDLGIKFNK